MSTVGRKKLTLKDLCKEIEIKALSNEDYDKLKFPNKSNLVEDKAYVIQDNTKNKGYFIAGIVNESKGLSIRAKDLNRAKNLFNEYKTIKSNSK